ncbi:HNRNPA1 [Cervus elaphus hippelaphus]|uniref:HNRNPA1 n=1 Tax=Cervus elaphus hippelaphus TaxID=46360 RepID=A0A212CDH2_CEREH|nr:HNRNPA1 [Cervus elaphus hippelaphus]
MGNTHRLCGNESSKHQTLQRLRVCHTYLVEEVNVARKARPRKVMEELRSPRGPSQEKILKVLTINQKYHTVNDHNCEVRKA